VKPYDVVSALEEVVAEYGGSKYAVAVDSCTNAILLALKYTKMINEQWTDADGDKMRRGPELHFVDLPKKTYVGVAYAVLNAGLKCTFRDEIWSGAYKLGGTNIIDSARRFRKGMYVKNSLYCLSGHWGKHLRMGNGGFILTDDYEAATILKIMRFDGRTAGLPPKMDNFIYPSHHCYMIPENAARGLMLMSYMPDDNLDIPWDEYCDLSQFPIFRDKWEFQGN
jgi:dTDP-4-amino-4,6-dideoxygalactose transaminase